jgi:Kef-type K+ transport system membrane component KefB
VAVADVAAIVALPLVLQPSKAGAAALGGLAVAAAAAALFGGAYVLRGNALIHRIRKESKHRGWALDLRLALLGLFVLAWLAVRSGTSVLIAGFSVGLVVALIGGPKRLSKQVTGIAAGFFIPLFFVVLGAKLDLRAVARMSRFISWPRPSRGSGCPRRWWPRPSWDCRQASSRSVCSNTRSPVRKAGPSCWPR